MLHALLLHVDTRAAQVTTPTDAMAELGRHARLTEELAQEGVRWTDCASWLRASILIP